MNPTTVTSYNIKLSGVIHSSNFQKIKDAILNKINSTKVDLITDNDFGQAKSEVKLFKKIESTLKSVKLDALDQAEQIQRLFSDIDNITEKTRQARLTLERHIKIRTQEIKDECIQEGIEHIKEVILKYGLVDKFADKSIYLNRTRFVHAVKGRSNINSVKDQINLLCKSIEGEISAKNLWLIQNQSKIASLSEVKKAIFQDKSYLINLSPTELDDEINRRVEVYEASLKKEELASVDKAALIKEELPSVASDESSEGSTNEMEKQGKTLTSESGFRIILELDSDLEMIKELQSVIKNNYSEQYKIKNICIDKGKEVLSNVTVSQISKNAENHNNQIKLVAGVITHEQAVELTVKNEDINAQSLIYEKFGLNIDLTNKKFSKLGWFYQCKTKTLCVSCNNRYYELIRCKVYSYGGIFLRGLICIKCKIGVLAEDLPFDKRRELDPYIISPKEKGEKIKQSIYSKDENETKQQLIKKDQRSDPFVPSTLELKQKTETALNKLNKYNDIFFHEYYFPLIRSEIDHMSSEFSKKILELKSNSEVVPYFLKILKKTLYPDGVSICCVPGHDSGKAVTNLRLLCIEFCSQMGFEDLSSCLRRHKSTSRSSLGLSKRTETKILNSVSLRFKERLKGKVVVLIDDVSVSGCSLYACRKILCESEVYHVFCLSLGATPRIIN